MNQIFIKITVFFYCAFIFMNVQAGGSVMSINRKDGTQTGYTLTSINQITFFSTLDTMQVQDTSMATREFNLSQMGLITFVQPSLSISPRIINTAALSGSRVKSYIKSNMIWRAQADSSWITVGAEEGIKSDSLLITVEKNYRMAVRTGHVIVRAGNLIDTLTVTQNAASATLSVSPTLFSMAAQRDTLQASIRSNSSWTLTSKVPAWLTLGSSKGTGSQSIKVFAAENTSPTSRQGTIAVTVIGAAGKIINVTQDGAIVLSDTLQPVTMQLGKVSRTFVLANYFDYQGELSYTLSSDNNAVVKPALKGGEFGLVAYSEGQASISITAVSKYGTSKTLSFFVTVSAVEVKNCKELLVVESIANPKCFGESTGGVSLSVSGGARPYSFKWSNTGSDSLITNVPAGRYAVVVSDSLGCVASKQYEVTAPAALQIVGKLTPSKCNESTGAIAVSVSNGKPSYKYNWSNNSTYATQENLAAGVYVVTVQDAAGCKQSQSFELNNKNAPIIAIDSVNSSQCSSTVGSIAVTVSEGSTPYKYLWSDKSTSEDRLSVRPGIYSLTVTDAALCKATISTEVRVARFSQPSISLVTVDKDSVKNLVVWLREQTNIIKAYNIYRETNKAGVYTKIGSVPYSQTSIFLDPDAEPQTRSWRYKISAVDNCDKESALSTEYKTMCLQQNIGNGGVINLLWDSYEGTDYYTYLVYRRPQGQKMQLLDSLPASLNRYIDKSPLKTSAAYYVAIELPASINPFLFKTDTGPFSQSLSNVSEASLVTKQETAFDEVSISPNPAKDVINIKATMAEGKEVSLIAPNGQLLAKTNIANGRAQFDVSKLAKGLYTVQLQTNSEVAVKTVVVE